ncbi:hypothetical protein LIA77_04036 [Sarocladium implicatum]|nr:hypothetical protein LIA77_04036 [Sarocladium implicatum]
MSRVRASDGRATATKLDLGECVSDIRGCSGQTRQDDEAATRIARIVRTTDCLPAELSDGWFCSAMYNQHKVAPVKRHFSRRCLHIGTRLGVVS